MTTMKVWDGTGWQSISLPVTGGTTWVGPDPPAGTPMMGAMWYDTDDASVLDVPVTVANGGTGQATVAGARTALAVPAIGNSAVTAGAPTTGTWARGDQWVDSVKVLWICTTGGTPGTWMAKNAGEELAYNEITASVTVTATTEAGPQVVIEGTSRSYDGSPIVVNCYLPSVYLSGSTQIVFNLWDAGTDLGRVGACIAGAGYMFHLHTMRRLTPTVGTHNYRLVGWLPVGTSVSLAVGSGANAYNPGTVRVTRS